MYSVRYQLDELGGDELEDDESGDDAMAGDELAADELADDEMAEARAETQSHVDGPLVAHGGLTFQTVDVGGALLLDADSE